MATEHPTVVRAGSARAEVTSLSRVEHLGEALCGAGRLPDLVQALESEVCAVLDARGIALLRPSGEPDRLEVVAARGYPEDTLRRWCTGATALPAAVMASGEPVFLAAQAFACVPLRVEQRSIGALCLTFAQTRSFNDEERTFVALVAREVTHALTRIRLREAERVAFRRAAEDAVAARLLAAHVIELTTAITPLSVAAVALTHAARASSAVAATISWLTEDGEHLEIACSVGYAAEALGGIGRLSAAARTPRADVLARGVPMWLERDQPGTPELDAPPGNVHQSAWAVVPAVGSTGTLAVLALRFDGPRRFAEEERSLLMALASQCGQALERAHLYETERRARAEQDAAQQHLAFLAEASRALAEAHLDLHAIADAVANLCTESLASSCVLGLMSEDGIWMEPVAIHHRDPETRARMREALDATPARTADGLAARIRDASEGCLVSPIDPTAVREMVSVAERSWIEAAGLGSLVVVPLRAAGQVCGALYCGRGPTELPLEPSDQALACQLADRASLALENARVYEQARAQRQRLAAVLEQMPSAVVIVEAPSGKLVMANEQNERIFRGRVGPLSELTDCRGFHPDGREYRAEDWPLTRSITTGETFTGIEIDVARGDGERRTIRCNAAPIRDPGGTIVAGLVTYDDITREKEAQSRVAALYREAQAAVRIRDEFMSIASHELRTPVTSLQLHVEGLLRRIKKGMPMDAEHLSGKLMAAHRQILRLNDLVGELLDVSRIAAGRLEIAVEEVDLAELARDVVTRFEDQAGKSGSALTFRSNGPIVGVWDRSRLDQVITNLVSNAIKYGRARPVEVEVAAEGGTALCVVRDHGFGIAPEHQARIFDRFERLVSTRHLGGFGLGLWICRQIVEALGGSIVVTSEADRGSVFVVRLPAA